MDFEMSEQVKLLLDLLHPIVMWVLFFMAIYETYLGIQARRTREGEKETRKKLVKGKFKSRHFQTGSIFMSIMMIGTIGAMGVTYINNGKLFVDPHLIAGLVMMTMIVVSSSLVPFMQKGNQFARVSHISLNAVMLVIFGWQAVTGMEILGRILEIT